MIASRNPFIEAFYHNTVKQVKEGVIAESRINDAVRRFVFKCALWSWRRYTLDNRPIALLPWWHPPRLWARTDQEMSSEHGAAWTCFNTYVWRINGAGLPRYLSRIRYLWLSVTVERKLILILPWHPSRGCQARLRCCRVLSFTIRSVLRSSIHE